ncbi:sialomucin core protein 24-like [Ruditapes philippinarum]|uniref:sialomucin core protein 24-like n=1 Tax=Ruditapes philippinarum TaxID=129788 RepID=UPI00295ACF2B|nr:sialomucin core protein 24-like [Ruditapes philippinarum]
MLSNLVLVVCLCAFSCGIVSTEDATEDGCFALTTNETCCSQTECMWFTCDDANVTEDTNKTREECHLQSWTDEDKCKNNTVDQTCKSQVKPTTSQAPTAVPDPCAAGTDRDTCCGIANCSFTNCTSLNESALEACVSNVSAHCKPDTNINQCGPATPATASTTPQPTDVCVTYDTSTECCSHVDQNCTYITCTGSDNNPHEGCHVKSSNFSIFCQDTPQHQCNAGTSTSPKPDVTTQPPNNGSSTQSSDTSANTGDSDQGQHFDGASFIGGIVLCLGIVAIIFFGLKFYRARTERNYHTL